MLLPFDISQVEKFSEDPVKKRNGVLWFNTSENVFKTWIDEVLHIFVTTTNTSEDLENIITDVIRKTEYTVKLTNVFEAVVTHNTGEENFIFTVFDSVENCSIPCSLTTIDKNSFKFEFVDSITGHITIKFLTKER